MSGRHVPNGEYQKVYSSRFIAGCFRHCTSTQCFVGTSANGPTAPARHSRLEARATQTWQVDSGQHHRRALPWRATDRAVGIPIKPELVTVAPSLCR
jgi:hypothetical protein